MSKKRCSLTHDEEDKSDTRLLSSYTALIDGLREIATPDDVITNTTGPVTVDDILEATSIRIRKLLALKAHAFLIANDDFEFEIYTCRPKISRGFLARSVESWIDDGLFSWALNQNRAVIQHDQGGGDAHVLHVITTRSRTVGMFVGRIAPDATIDDGILALLSVVLMNCASGLESLELHTALQQHNENLETLIHERTAELEIERDRAERVAAEKSLFLATMSHEIRTPMNGVIGMAQLLKESGLNQEQQGLTNTILQSGQALVHLINDVLDIAKVEAGRLELDLAPFDMVQLFNSVVDLLKPQAAAKGVSISLEFNEHIDRYVIGDAGRIRQVILNLVGNAIKFTPDGVIRVSIDICDQCEGKQFYISIEDNGIGIREENIGRLFNPFEQSDSSISSKHGGTGLGLAICKQLIELMGGDIGVTSEYGRGSTFWLTLALPHSDDSEIAQQGLLSQAEEKQIVDDSTLQGSVLVAEDNEVNQRVISLMLKSLGLSCTVANNGLEVFDHLGDSAYDLILMDCQMPRLDGYQTTKRIRNGGDDFHNIPIIALTANAMESDRKACHAAGMDDFLAKPIDQSKLKQLLEKWLNPRAEQPSSVNADSVRVEGETEPSANDDELIDCTALQSLIDIMEDEFTGLCDIFIQNSKLKMAKLSAAIAAENSAEVVGILHFLKGSCSSVAAVQLTAMVTRIETLAKQGELKEIEQQLPALERCYRNTIDEINRLAACRSGH